MLVKKVTYMYWKLYLILKQEKWQKEKDTITQIMGRKKEDEIFDIVNVKFWLNFRVGNIIKCKNTE